MYRKIRMKLIQKTPTKLMLCFIVMTDKQPVVEQNMHHLIKRTSLLTTNTDITR